MCAVNLEVDGTNILKGEVVLERLREYVQEQGEHNCLSYHCCAWWFGTYCTSRKADAMLALASAQWLHANRCYGMYCGKYHLHAMLITMPMPMPSYANRGYDMYFGTYCLHVLSFRLLVLALA